MKVSVAEAKNTLPKLIKAVEDGESVTIYRHGTPVVDIVRTTKGHPEKPKFGELTAHMNVTVSRISRIVSGHRGRRRPRRWSSASTSRGR